MKEDSKFFQPYLKPECNLITEINPNTLKNSNHIKIHIKNVILNGKKLKSRFLFLNSQFCIFEDDNKELILTNLYLFKNKNDILLL